MRTRISGEPAVARNLRGHESPSPEPPRNRSCVAAKVVYQVVTIDYFLEIPHVIIQLWTYSSGLSLRVSLISARSPGGPPSRALSTCATGESARHHVGSPSTSVVSRGRCSRSSRSRMRCACRRACLTFGEFSSMQPSGARAPSRRFGAVALEWLDFDGSTSKFNFKGSTSGGAGGTGGAALVARVGGAGGTGLGRTAAHCRLDAGHTRSSLRGDSAPSSHPRSFGVAGAARCACRARNSARAVRSTGSTAACPAVARAGIGRAIRRASRLPNQDRPLAQDRCGAYALRRSR